MVDAWLVSHSLPSGATSTTPSGGSVDTELSSPGGGSATGPGGQRDGPDGRAPKAGSGAATPVRKVSAHEFERGGLLRPLVSNVDGTLTFISPALSEDAHALISHYAKPRRRNRHELRSLDEKELIFELVKDICNDLDVRSLCHKILQVSDGQAPQERSPAGVCLDSRPRVSRPNPVYAGAGMSIDCAGIDDEAGVLAFHNSNRITRTLPSRTA